MRLFLALVDALPPAPSLSAPADEGSSKAELQTPNVSVARGAGETQ